MATAKDEDILGKRTSHDRNRTCTALLNSKQTMNGSIIDDAFAELPFLSSALQRVDSGIELIIARYGKAVRERIRSKSRLVCLGRVR